MGDQFVDSTPGTAGTTQDAGHMDALVVAGSYLKSGGIPGTSGTLVATQPATEVVINRGDGTAVFVPISATTVTMTANSDNYVDVTTAGAYTVSAVSVGAGAPSQAAQTLRLYKATTSGTAITAVTRLALGAQVPQAQVQVDLTEAATNDTLSVAGSGLLINLNRLRYQLGQVVGGAGSAWDAAVQMLPLSQKGAASGVPSLDSNSHVVQPVAHGYRQTTVQTETDDIASITNTTWVSFATSQIGSFSMTNTAGGSFLLRAAGAFKNTSGSTQNIALRGLVDGVTTVYLGSADIPAGAYGTVGGFASVSPTPQAHSFVLQVQVSGGSFSCNCTTDRQKAVLAYEVVEIA